MYLFLKCTAYSTSFADLDVPLKYDSCSTVVYGKYSGLTAVKLKCIIIKNRFLKYFYSACDQSLK